MDILNFFKRFETDLFENMRYVIVEPLDKRTTVLSENLAEFKDRIEKGGFVLAHWDGTPETEQKIKEATKATIRAIPLDNPQEEGKCIFSGKPSKERVIFAKAY